MSKTGEKLREYYKKIREKRKDRPPGKQYQEYATYTRSLGEKLRDYVQDPTGIKRNLEELFYNEAKKARAEAIKMLKKAYNSPVGVSIRDYAANAPQYAADVAGNVKSAVMDAYNSPAGQSVKEAVVNAPSDIANFAGDVATGVGDYTDMIAQRIQEAQDQERENIINELVTKYPNYPRSYFDNYSLGDLKKTRAKTERYYAYQNRHQYKPRNVPDSQSGNLAETIARVARILDPDKFKFDEKENF